MAIHNFAYVCNNGGNTVSVLDLVAFTATSVTVGTNPKFCAMAPSGNEVWVSNPGSNNVSVIATATNTVVATITGFNNPQALGFSNDGTMVYVVNFGTNTILPVTVATRVVGVGIATTHSMSVVNPLAGGLAMNPTANSLSVLTLDGSGDPTAVQQVSIPGGGLSPFIPVTFAQGGAASSGICYDAGGNFIYRSDRSFPDVGIYSVPGNSFSSFLTTSQSPFAMAATPDGTKVYIGGQSGSNADLYVLTVATNTITATVLTGVAASTGIFGMSITGDGTQLVLTSNATTQAQVWSIPGNTLQHTFGSGPIGSGPYGVCTTPLPVFTEQIVMLV